MALYDAAKDAFLSGTLSWLGSEIRVALIDTALYTVDLTIHTDINDIPSAAIIADVYINGLTVSGGVADANDTSIPSVTGATVEAVVFYDGTSNMLIAYIDDSPSLPSTPNGNSITLIWDADGIFEIN